MQKEHLNKILSLTATLIALIALAIVFLKPSVKTGWIDLPAVYKEFDYKKEMEAKLIRTEEARKQVLDSLEFELRILSEEINAGEQKDKQKIQVYQRKGEDYMNKKKLFEEDNYMNKNKAEEQILNQLNQYVRDYGAKNNYSFIYGADGTGTIMYGDKTIDITEQVKVYVNEKYKGVN